MSAKKFKFVSPGVFLSEIDNSQLPKQPGGVGPVVIGRTRRGPALKPVKVSSFQEFVEIFGEPVPGNEGEDPWRDGNGLLAPAYAPYAAQAYLKADINSPVTVIRLLGVQGDDASESGGEPGWALDSSGAAIGLFVAASASAMTASLAGVVYTTEDAFEVGVRGTGYTSDTTITQNATASGAATTVEPVKITNDSFKLRLKSSLGELIKTVSFQEGAKYIRDELNTNPVATNSYIMTPPSSSLASKYWLGETFEEEYERVKRKSTAGSLIVFPVRLVNLMADFKSSSHGLAAASSGWAIPQYTDDSASFNPAALGKLFRFHAIQEGEQGMDLNIKIENIKIADPGNPSPYGRFDVVIEQKRGGRIYPVDSYENLNLNPNSNDFIARRIGDQYFQWDGIQKRNKVYGSYPNQSNYVRVEMDSGVGENGPSNPKLVPFGFLGPIVPVSSTGSTAAGISTHSTSWATGSISGSALTGLKLAWPESPHVITGSTGVDLAAKYIMGSTQYNKDSGGTPNFSSANKGMKDYLRRYGSFAGLVSSQVSGLATATSTKHSYVFSLDDVIITGATTANIGDLSEYAPSAVVFTSGSHAAGTAYTSLSSGSAASLTSLVSSFSMPLAAGSDGVDITEADPFNMRVIGTDSTTKNSYAHASVDRAIELIRDPEALEMNLAVMPGITKEALTTKLIQVCEARADALAIIDLPNIYVPPAEAICTNFQDRVDGTNPEKSAKALTARQLNSSYGAAYYPWVKVRDTVNDRDVWAPPSVIALGVMGYTEQRDEVWFAPAGFNRGGLNEGNAGLPVLQASEQLLSSQRDTLYEANINPIASFVSEGLVVFGQKTLQLTPSALDRINVRRLLIFVKKEVSRIANGLLFDQNVPATWNRFTGQVVPLLESVKTRLGLSDFKVVLDKTTTTPDLIDRNIMYAKIFLKPARAIEFIAVDFVITRTGASFDD